VTYNTEDIEVKKGAYGYRLIFTLYDADESARDCTGYTADLRFWAPGASSAKKADLTWIDDSAGTCYYDVEAGDFDSANQYYYEIVIEKTGVKDPAKTGRIIVIDRPTTDAS